MKKDPNRDKKYQLLHILKNHDVEGMKQFIYENSEDFKELLSERDLTDDYLFDLLHVYKAHLLYLGAQHFESMDYCRKKGLIQLSGESERVYDNQEEIQKCVITLGSDQDRHLK